MSAQKVKALIFDALMTTYFLVAPVFIFVAPDNEAAQIQLLALWPWALLILVLCFGFCFWTYHQGFQTLGRFVFSVPPEVHSRPQPANANSVGSHYWSWQLGVFFVITFSFGLIATRFSFVELLDHNGFSGALRLFGGLMQPNLSVMPRAIVHIVQTIFLAFTATAFALPVSFALSFLGAKNIFKGPQGRLVYFLVRNFLNIVRSIEALIWAIIFSVWVGIGPFAGMLALLIHSIASLSKQFSEIIEGADRGPIEGIESTGARPSQVIWFGIVPQVILPFVSFSIYRWDINVRMATVIGLVGGGGIGTMLIQYQGQAMWPEVGCIVLVIVFVVWMMDVISARLREALK